MEVLDMILAIAAATPALVGAWVGTHHARAPMVLAVALRQPSLVGSIVSRSAALTIARFWGVVELCTGALVLTAVLHPWSRSVQVPLLLWLTVMHLGFVTWLTVIGRRVPGATCGCSSDAEPADGAALSRAILLGAFAALPLLVLLGGHQSVLSTSQWTTMPVAGAFAALVYFLPSSIRMMRKAS
jgi:hypothetical protein